MASIPRPLCVAALLAVAASLAPAQDAGRAVFRGVVTTARGQARVSGAEVLFQELGRAARTNDDGTFVLGGISAGVYNVIVRRAGFKPITGTVRLADADTIDYRFDLVAQDAKLPPVEVRDTAASPALREFDRRRRTTGGEFLTQDQIRQTGSESLTSVIRTRISGFQLVPHPSGFGTAIASGHKPMSYRGGGGNDCYCQVWWNGQIFWHDSPIASDYPPRLEDFNLQEIAAMEFYRGSSEIPPEFTMYSSSCGVVVIWTQVVRRGRGRP